MAAWTLRSMNRIDESLEIQLRLEKECAAANEPDPYVFEELEALYRAKGNEERARHYAALRKPPVQGLATTRTTHYIYNSYLCK